MSQFLIFGRPRSRTAWVSNFLTVPGQSFCYHEGMLDVANPIGLKTKMDRTLSRVTGNSDTGMIHNTREILRVFPDAKLVVLTGAGLSWKRFSQEHRFDRHAINEVDRAYWDTKRVLKNRAAFVDVGMLMRDTAVAKMLWEHCGGHPMLFDEERYLMLRNLNIQVISETLQQRIASRISHG